MTTTTEPTQRFNRLLIAICAALLVLLAAQYVFILASVPAFYQLVAQGEVPTLSIATGITLSQAIFTGNAARRGLNLPAYALYFLALAYQASVQVLQNIFQAVTGQGQNQLVTVISTLGIAALFVPLRRRVQSFIDRRFYRRKYDSARILAAFATSMRDEVNLDDLARRLVGVVDTTMQPMDVSLWLRSLADNPYAPETAADRTGP